MVFSRDVAVGPLIYNRESAGIVQVGDECNHQHPACSATLTLSQAFNYGIREDCKMQSKPVLVPS